MQTEIYCKQHLCIWDTLLIKREGSHIFLYKNITSGLALPNEMKQLNKILIVYGQTNTYGISRLYYPSIYSNY